MKRTLYLKIEQAIELAKSDVTIGDVAKLECTDTSVLNRLKTEKLFSMDTAKGSRRMTSNV